MTLMSEIVYVADYTNYLFMIPYTNNAVLTIVSDPQEGSCVEVITGGGSGPRLVILCNFHNVELECKVKIISTTQLEILQQYARGGHHFGSNLCTGSAYKGAFRTTLSHFVKEVNHPAFTAIREENQVLYTNIVGRWATYKTVIKDMANGDVILENYVDGVKTDSTMDNGGWQTDAPEPDWIPTCSPLENGNVGFRQRDEILNKIGCLVTWRTDLDTIWRFKYLKVTKLPEA